MYDHELGAVKGWPSPYAVDKRVQAGSGVTGIVPGMCLKLDPTTGLASRGTVNGAMGLFVWQGQDHFDVNGDVGNIIGGNMNCLVATGAYELETTEFTGVGFNPNVPLTAVNAGGATQGKLQATTIGGGLNIVGVVSEAGPLTNEFAKTVIRFWPVYLPAGH
jgi:hypothetical protein